MYKWNKYPFLLLLIALAIGILFQYYFLSVFSLKYTVFSCFVVFSALIALQFKSSIKVYWNRLNTVLIFSTTFLLGILLSHYQDNRNDKKWYGHYISNAEAWLLTIKEKPQIKDKIVKIPCAANAVKKPDNWVATSGVFYVNLYKNTYNKDLKVGEQIIIPNQLDTIRNSNNPFAFKYADYLQLQNIYHQVFMPLDDVLLLNNTSENGNNFITSSSNFIRKIIVQNVRDSTTASILYATILNDRSQLDPDLWKSYSKTGIAHIIAISGMHVSIFFLFVYGLLYWIRHRKYHWIKYAIAIPVIWIYIAITGFPASAVRAGVMFSLLSIGLFIGRKPNNLNTLFTTAFILLVYRPWWLFDVGFQLSFLSVLSIFLFYTKISTWVMTKNRSIKYLWNIVAVSLSVQVLLAPLIVYYFHQFPLFGVLANIPASIFSLVFMFTGLIIIIFGSLGMDMNWLGNILSWLTQQFHSIISFFADVSPGFFYELYLGKLDFWITIVAITLLGAFWLTKQKWAFFTGLSILLLLVLKLNINEYQCLQQNQFVVYQINNKLLMQHIQGKMAYTYANTVLNQKDSTYTILPAKIGFGSDKFTTTSQTIWSFNQQTIAVLNGNLNATEERFKVDYLIIENGQDFDFKQIVRTFQPKMIVLSSNLKRYKAEAWSAQLTAEGISYWNVYRDGAFILD